MNAKYKYCPYCSATLIVADINGHSFKMCPDKECGFVHWNNPVPVVVTIIARRHKIALVKRKFDPRRGFWCPPCGFVDEGEGLQDGSQREPNEETGLTVKVDKTPFHIANPPGINEHVSFFRARSFTGKLVAGDDAEDAGWYSADDLPELAFSTHEEVVKGWFSRPSVRMWRLLARICATVGLSI